MSHASILLVEDDRALLAGMHDFLELSGYDVMTAENGLVALDELDVRKNPPDLIVSDIMMPDMDGYEFLAAVRAREEWVGIPFVFLTAKTTPQDIRSGKQHGADDYITKPFDVEDLLVAIEARLQRHADLMKLNESRLTSAKRRILTALNHEFRTSLSYVITYSDMIVNGTRQLDAQELHDYLVGIHNGGERLMKLVEDFLLMAEIETGLAARTYDLRRETIPNFGNIVAGVVEEFQVMAGEFGLELDFICEDDLPPIQGDYGFLKIVIRHLLDNALKFSKGHGERIEIELADMGEEVALIVADDGVGISPSKHALVFELFYQDNRKKFEQQGVGAGLNIVKNLVEFHGGRVTVDSEDGVGTTVTVFLPPGA